MSRLLLLAAALAALCCAYPYKQLPGFVDINVDRFEELLSPVYACVGLVCKVSDAVDFILKAWPDSATFTWEAQYTLLGPPACGTDPSPGVCDYGGYRMQVWFYCGPVSEDDKYLLDSFDIPWSQNYTYNKQYLRNGTIQNVYCDLASPTIILSVESIIGEPWWENAIILTNLQFRYVLQ